MKNRVWKMHTRFLCESRWKIEYGKMHKFQKIFWLLDFDEIFVKFCQTYFFIKINNHTGQILKYLAKIFRSLPQAVEKTLPYKLNARWEFGDVFISIFDAFFGRSIVQKAISILVKKFFTNFKNFEKFFKVGTP